MTQAVPIHVINLDRRPDRWARLSGRLDALGLTASRLPAVDGRAGPPATLDRTGPAKGPIGPLSDTTRACTASHVAAWRRVAEEGAGHALILEDDVALHPGLADALSRTDWLAGLPILKVEKFNAHRPSTVLLGRPLAHAPKTGIPARAMYSRHTGGAGYIVSADAARHLLTHEGRIDVPVDHFLFNETVSPLPRGAWRPAMLERGLVRQDRDAGTDIDLAEGRRRSAAKGLAELRLLPRQLLWLASGRARPVRVTAAEGF